MDKTQAEQVLPPALGPIQAEGGMKARFGRAGNIVHVMRDINEITGVGTAVCGRTGEVYPTEAEITCPKCMRLLKGARPATVRSGAAKEMDKA